MKISAANLKKIHEAKHQIDLNYKQHITIDRLATEQGLTAHRFKEMFKQVHGTRVFDYLVGIRLKEAKRLLKETDYKTSAVAKEVGYATKQSLSTAFKKYLNSSPGEYRKSTFEDTRAGACPCCGRKF